MVEIRLRYVTRRRNASGRVRLYWQRRGWPLVRMPAGLSDSELVALVAKLNAQVDGEMPRRTGPMPGTFGAMVRGYEASDAYLSRAVETRRIYAMWLKRLDRDWSDIPVPAIDTPTVRTYLDGVPSLQSKAAAAAVISCVLAYARDHGHVDTNAADRLKLRRAPARGERFTAEECTIWLDAAARHPDGARMATVFLVLLYTAQRPSDSLAMPWSHYDGATITLRQQKTRRLMRVPCHGRLRAHLDATKKAPRSSTLICGGLAYDPFNRAWRQICKAAGMPEKQARDLRRTAVVMAAEAGATDIQISAVTGHGLGAIKSILDAVYLVRTDQMAESAIALWENADGTESDNALDRLLGRPRKTAPED